MTPNRFACTALLVVLLAGVAEAASNGLSAPYSWFDETYQKFKVERTNKWTTAAGAWRRQAVEDLSAYSNGVMHLDTRGNEMLFEPGPYKTSAKNGAVSVTSHMTFVACRNGEEWDISGTIPHAAIAMRCDAETGDLVFIGLKTTRDGSVVKFRWTDLSAPGVTPVENTYFDVTVDSDYSCVPTRVRYSVNGHVLADANGETWFSSRGGSLDPAGAANLNKYAKYVGFRGRGEIGHVTGVQSTNRAARATISFDALSRPQAGSLASFSVSTNDGQTLSGALSYKWYLIDAAGMAGAAKSGETGATYTLTAADYGHWVAVDVFDARGYAGTGRFWFSDLPVVYMDVGTATGYEVNDDETAQVNVDYFWADDGDNFTRLEVEPGDDLAPYREQYARLFSEKTKTSWPSSKKESHAGKITILGNAEYKDQVKNMDFTIHVRGNSTAGADKKPYKIKLDKKTDLFGLGDGVKNKHWTLLANCYDESLMRNKICYDLSGVFGCPVWMRSEWVDVVMNGQYVGNYLVCQHIRVSEERIDIYDWKDAGDTIAEKALEANPALTGNDQTAIEDLLETNCTWMTTGRFVYHGTNYVVQTSGTPGVAGNGDVTVVWKKFSTDTSGGYVFEIDAKKVKGGSAPAPCNFVQSNKTPYGTMTFNLAMNTPEYLFSNETLSNYVWNVWWDLGQAWMRPDGYNTKGRHYTELAGIKSMVGYWLAQYIPGNDDAAAFSRYSYMDVGGKMKFGPAWDFDYGLGSLQIRIRTACTTNVDGRVSYAPINPEKFIPGNGGGNFMGHWTADPYFTFRLYERYWATRGYLNDIVRAGGLIDQYKEKIGNSARANDLRWNNRIGFWGDANELGDVEQLRNFLARRFTWFDRKFATAGAAATNLTATVAASTTYNGTTLRYTRERELAPTFDGATPTLGSPETEVVDVTVPLGGTPVTATVAAPGSSTTKLVVYVNGLSNGVYAVANQSARISIPAASLKTGETNVVSLVALKSDGSVRRRNFALLACRLPERVAAADGGHDVEISWLSDVWDSFLAANPKTKLDAPKTYFEYLAFATNASPYEKSVPLYYDYLAGTDPAATNEFLQADIALGANGLPSVGWTPDRPELRAARVYTLFGAPVLEGPWASTDALNPAPRFCETNRFFRIGVRLKKQ